MKVNHFFLKVLRKLYEKLFSTNVEINSFDLIDNPDQVADIIQNELNSTKPTMIARYGATELMVIMNYRGVKFGPPNLLDYIIGNEFDWWWNKKTFEQIQQWSGFFPANEETVSKFCELMLDDSQQVDILASWLKDEKYLSEYLKSSQFIKGIYLDPFWSKIPWTAALENKKVLVVHPFAELIEQQYKTNRTKLFAAKNILPEFKLETIPAVQSLGGKNSDFTDWFAALQWMKDEIDKHDYDVCLIGAGAYGFPLAAHVKRSGKKAVHMGGSLQLLFGIKGKRWEDPNYNPTYNYAALMNEYWVRPGEQLKPENAEAVEGACYW